MTATFPILFGRCDMADQILFMNRGTEGRIGPIRRKVASPEHLGVFAEVGLHPS
jgi:hypothetical protein